MNMPPAAPVGRYTPSEEAPAGRTKVHVPRVEQRLLVFPVGALPLGDPWSPQCLPPSPGGRAPRLTSVLAGPRSASRRHLGPAALERMCRITAIFWPWLSGKSRYNTLPPAGAAGGARGTALITISPARYMPQCSGVYRGM